MGGRRDKCVIAPTTNETRSGTSASSPLPRSSRTASP